MYLISSLIVILLFCTIIICIFKSDSAHDLKIKIEQFEITIYKHKE